MTDPGLRARALLDALDRLFKAHAHPVGTRDCFVCDDQATVRAALAELEDAQAALEQRAGLWQMKANTLEAATKALEDERAALRGLVFRALSNECTQYTSKEDRAECWDAWKDDAEAVLAEAL